MHLCEIDDADAGRRSMGGVFCHYQQGITSKLSYDLDIRVLKFHYDLILEEFNHIADSCNPGKTVGFSVIWMAHFGHDLGHAETVGQAVKRPGCRYRL